MAMPPVPTAITLLEKTVRDWTFKIIKDIDDKMKYVVTNSGGKMDSVYNHTYDVHIETLVDTAIMKVSNSCTGGLPEVLLVTYDQIKEGDKILPTQDNDAIFSVIILSKQLVCEVEASTCGVSTLPCDVIYEGEVLEVKFTGGVGLVIENPAYKA
jgi:hypothetical protein